MSDLGIVLFLTTFCVCTMFSYGTCLQKIRHERSLPVPIKKDSTYKPVERKQRRFSALRVPLKLQAALPFASKPKHAAPQVSESNCAVSFCFNCYFYQYCHSYNLFIYNFRVNEPVKKQRPGVRNLSQDCVMLSSLAHLNSEK